MSGRLHQVHASMASGFGSLVMGCLNVWPSYTTQLYSSNATTPLSAPTTQVEESLLGSLPSLGAMLGAAIAGTIIDRLGRRNGGVALSLPNVISWAIISVSTNINLVLAARFLSGVAGGGFMILAPVFISEVAEDSIRGALATSSIFLYCFGCVMSYLMGWFLSYHAVIWLNMAVSVVCTIIILVVVESPVYYIRQKRDEDARQSIAKYRGVPATSMVVADEFSRLKQQLMPSVELTTIKETETKAEEAEKEKLNAESVAPEIIKPMSPIKTLFVSAAPRKAFFIVLIIITNQVLMGIVPVQVFAKTVFMQADPDNADLYTVLFALVMFLGCIVTTFVADLAGRRILLILSSIMVSACMAALGFLINSASPYVTVFLILVYCFSFMFGAGSVPYVLMAEVFLPEVQSIASIIIVEWVWFLNFVIIGIFPFMLNTIGISGSFLAFACMGVANAVIGYFIVPETKGLSNEQIQDMLSVKKK